MGSKEKIYLRKESKVVATVGNPLLGVRKGRGAGCEFMSQYLSLIYVYSTHSFCLWLSTLPFGDHYIK